MSRFIGLYFHSSAFCMAVDGICSLVCQGSDYRCNIVAGFTHWSDDRKIKRHFLGMECIYFTFALTKKERLALLRCQKGAM